MTLLGRIKEAVGKRLPGRRPPAALDRPPSFRHRNFFLMLHPTRVRADSLRPTATFGLGLISLALLLILAATGVLLMFHYVPSTDPQQGAYASIQELHHAIAYGQLVRSMHRWAADLLVVVVFLHLCRVFLRGAFKPPRRFNWVIGALLLILVLAESFSGQLLPWDQHSYWAVEVGTRLLAAVPWAGEPLRRLVLGGGDIGQLALVRFYGLHVFVLPLALLVLLAAHLWRIRQAGGLAQRCENEGAAAVEPPTVPAWPHLVLRETAILVACLLVVMVLALVWSAPLGERADPAHPPTPVKAAWFFLWLQELVSYDYGPLMRLHWPPWNSAGPTLGSEFWGGVLAPAVCFAVLLLVPYANPRPRRAGVGIYFARERRRACLVFCAVMAAIAALTVIGYFFRGPDWRLIWPW